MLGHTRHHRGMLVAAVVLTVFAVAALWPGLLAAADPVATDYNAILQPPSAEHLLGTDQLGRDLYSRLIHGTRPSLVIGLGSTLVGLMLGAVIGLLAGVGPRIVETTLMRLTDIGLAFPEILLALLVLAVLGPGTINVLLAIGIGSAPGYARLIRAQARTVYTSLYVRSAVGFGLHPIVVFFRHVLPNAFGPVLVLATISAGTNIIIAAGLSFLGFGAAPPTPEWGLALAEGRNFVQHAWWIALAPGVAITVVVIALTVVGKHLESQLAGRS
ncbi:ABC transporter permease [Rhodococcus rhodochrous]|uniref:ABC transporter permease n=1 Tax=Rhodococcus rhodochrous TaxID=1829 RepID=UPI001E29139D|nr:ABC transporter permease [Rhodococcus rhodochrous]MCB8913387.1 ABC transporter permease [Rhodococcus rhodochrous]